MNNPRLNQSRGLIDAPGRADRTLVRNFSLISLYQIVVRTGWIFKTESIVMPAVLDVMGGSGWLRGCLPMLNRFGQSIPPMLASDRIRRTAYKKQILAGSHCSFHG